jgi:hypothetical protein
LDRYQSKGGKKDKAIATPSSAGTESGFSRVAASLADPNKISKNQRARRSAL